MSDHSLGPLYDLLSDLYPERNARGTLYVTKVCEDLVIKKQHLYKVFADGEVPPTLANRIICAAWRKTTTRQEFDAYMVRLLPLLPEHLRSIAIG